ncbi:MAG: HAMP domain-containing protein [Alphaproteobacteria bacterium]|nr:HAMP domain-containing protein [Alphaproteobacteria bacterium]
MGLSLSKLKINTRLLLLIIVIAIGICAVLYLSANSIQTSVTAANNDQTRLVVETAHSNIEAIIKLMKSGEITEEKAQEEALKIVKALRYDSDQYFWINDLKGKMLMHPTQPNMIGTDILGIKDARGDNFFASMNDIAKKKGEGFHQYYWPPDSTAKPKVSYVKVIPEWNWVIGSGVFVDDVDEQIWSIEKKLGMTAGVVLLLTILIASLIGRSISYPIRAITDSMQRLASGELDIEIGMKDQKNEIGDMARAVVVFQDNAKQVEHMKAEQAETERRAAVEKKQVMEKLAGDFEASVGQIVSVVASASTELQSNAQNLSEMADQTSRQSSTVAAATEEASASVQTVASAAEELSASIGEINRQVEESARVAQDAVAKVKDTNATVSTLSEAAAQIGDVVKLIQDIAAQTNLLALNATIEAARAGEAGKGFAVVASEVKNLANQTGNATEEISRKIATVQSVSTEAANAIHAIGSTIEHISEITNIIANAIQQQTAATREISNNVQQASAGTSEVSSNIVNVTHAATESRGAANEVLQASGELSRQAERLRGEIGAFLSKVRQG